VNFVWPTLKVLLENRSRWQYTFVFRIFSTFCDVYYIFIRQSKIGFFHKHDAHAKFVGNILKTKFLFACLLGICFKSRVCRKKNFPCLYVRPWSRKFPAKYFYCVEITFQHLHSLCKILSSIFIPNTLQWNAPSSE